MSNEKMVTEKELTEAIRACIEDRATWFYLLLKEFKAAGCEVDEPAKKAIFKFGQLKGQKIGKAATPRAFFDGIGTHNAKLAFEFDEKAMAEDKGVMNFHYCALVEAWKKLGATPKEVAHLCELASCGDYGVVSCSPELELGFNGTIADGKTRCELIVTKKK